MQKYYEKTSLTFAVCVAVWSHQHLLQEEGRQRPLQAGTGSVDQRPAGRRLPHAQLVGVSRQDVTHTQEGLRVSV